MKFIFKKKLFFPSFSPLQIWPLKLVIQISQKSIMARNFKFGQRIQHGEVIIIDKLMVVDTGFHKHNY